MHPCFPWATLGLSTLVSLGCDDASTAFPAFSYGVDSAPAAQAVQYRHRAFACTSQAGPVLRLETEVERDLEGGQ